MTIRNARLGQHLRRERNVKDRQLTAMLIIQVICISILSMPISIEKIYSELTSYQIKSAEQVLIENILATFVVLLALMNTSTSFYLFTLTGKVFRKELKSLFFSNRRQTDVEPSVIAIARATARKSNFNGK
jgi:ABC-type microcin C transport system permease subunit YejB